MNVGGLRVAFLILGLSFGLNLGVDSAFAFDASRAAVDDFYYRVIAMPEMSLSGLLDRGLIEAHDSLVYTIPNAHKPMEHEIRTAQELAFQLGKPILVTSSMPGVKGFPGVDAILFDREGRPEANLSFKALLTHHRPGENSIRKAFARAWGSINTLFTMKHIAKLFGFDLIDDWLLKAPPGLGHEFHRRLLVTGVFKFLGLSTNGTRKVLVAVDLTRDPAKSVRLHRGRHLGPQHPGDDLFVELRDSSRKLTPIEAENLIWGVDDIKSRFRGAVGGILILTSTEFLSIQTGGTIYDRRRFWIDSASPKLACSGLFSVSI